MKNVFILIIISITASICSGQYVGFNDNREEKHRKLIISVDSMYANSIDTLSYWQKVGQVVRNGNKAIHLEFEDFGACETAKLHLGISNSGRSISDYAELSGVSLPLTISSALCTITVDSECIWDATFNSGIWDSEFFVVTIDRDVCETGNVYLTD